jgi:gamma-glutamylputrescine oxidase
MFQFQPQDQKFWTVCHKNIKSCTQNIDVEIAVIGGGIAGLSAAQAWASKGKKVALFEQFYCGAGATGKSAGFITPNCELSFDKISKESNQLSANNFWSFINNGIEKIRSNIKNHNFSCDYQEQKGLYVANSKKNIKNIIKEHQDLSKIDYPSEFLNQEQLKKIINSDKYVGGVTYNNSFGINPYEYVQELKNLLIDQGVEIFEETPILKIEDHVLSAPHATITADYIIICVDKFLPQFGIMTDNVYQIQNFVLTSEKISSQEIKQIFPSEPYMVWDSELIYNFYRIIQNERLTLGGGNLFSVYNKTENHNNLYAYKQLSNYFAKTFPDIKINFEYQWPGQIGISKDIAPIAGVDTKYPHIFYIAASAGLPIATSLGFYSMQHILENRTDLDKFFNPNRKYFISGIMQKLLGKKLSFAINNFIVQ